MSSHANHALTCALIRSNPKFQRLARRSASPGP